MASDIANASNTVIADNAVEIVEKSEITKSEGDELGATVKELKDLIQSRYEKGDLSDRDKTVFTEELISYLEQARLIVKTLEIYFEDVEKLLGLLKKRWS